MPDYKVVVLAVAVQEEVKLTKTEASMLEILAIFHDIYEMTFRLGISTTEESKEELDKIRRDVEDLISSILNTSPPMVVRAYEIFIEKWEEAKNS